MSAVKWIKGILMYLWPPCLCDLVDEQRSEDAPLVRAFTMAGSAHDITTSRKLVFTEHGAIAHLA